MRVNKMNQIKLRHNLLKTMFLISLTLGFSSNILAKTVTQPIDVLKIDAEADYLIGEPDKPAILIVHGFLTTNKFHTVVSMAKALHEEGYNVLSPTLTLNINKRKSSIKCNSIHAHTLEMDTIEIEDWVNWLQEKGHKNIVVLGHSSGSQELLDYLVTREKHNVDAAIFTSLFYLNGTELGTLQNEVEFAQNLIKQNIDRPNKYSFLFCKNNYFATPKSYLSYMKLDRNYVLESLSKLDIKHYTIMGSADKRYLSVGENWLEELQATGTQLITVDGANHFFSSEHEFDLQDNLIEIMDDLNKLTGQ